MDSYEKYTQISALRHYFPELFEEYAKREGQMQIRPGKTPPNFLHHFGTTWLVVSEDKTAFAVDCGSSKAISGIEKLMESKEITDVEGLWVTHYHDDHVNAIPEFQELFDCPCYADRYVAQVITDPMAWRLPCVSPAVARVDHVTTDGQSWQWREFRMTAYYLPGQTLYHDALLVEGHGLKLLFVGDSFTMGGIDDYCAGNRNWLGPGVGFDYSIQLVEKLRPTHMFNCHVADGFDFTPRQCRQMRASLREREELFGSLVPWEHANYGMDESWIRCHPYEQETSQGDSVSLEVVVTNHSADDRMALARAILPRAWFGQSGNASQRMTPWVEAVIPGKSEAAIPFSFSTADGTAPGRYVIAVDVDYDGRRLPQFAEAIVVIEA